MTEEKDLLSRYAKKTNPFRTPEGYFEQFATQLMEQLPEKQAVAEKEEKQPTLFRRLRPLWLAAAAVCGVIFCTTVTLMTLKRHARQTAPVATESTWTPQSAYQDFTEEELFEAMDYALVDNNDISMYLSEAY